MHHGVVPVEFTKLDHQKFIQIPREDGREIELLQLFEHRLNIRLRSAEALGSLSEIRR